MKQIYYVSKHDISAILTDMGLITVVRSTINIGILHRGSIFIMFFLS